MTKGPRNPELPPLDSARNCIAFVSPANLLFDIRGKLALLGWPVGGNPIVPKVCDEAVAIVIAQGFQSSRYLVPHHLGFGEARPSLAEEVVLQNICLRSP